MFEVYRVDQLLVLNTQSLIGKLLHVLKIGQFSRILNVFEHFSN